MVPGGIVRERPFKAGALPLCPLSNCTLTS
jgi:hypothetical protein